MRIVLLIVMLGGTEHQVGIYVSFDDVFTSGNGFEI